MSPLAGPLASSAGAQSAPSGGELGPVTPTKDLRPSRRLSLQQLATISQQLSQRDREALRLVSRFRVMSGAPKSLVSSRTGSSNYK